MRRHRDSDVPFRWHTSGINQIQVYPPSEGTDMAGILELFGSLLYILFIGVQVGLVSMLLVARLLKATGAIKEEEQRGIMGFLQGFC